MTITITVADDFVVEAIVEGHDLDLCECGDTWSETLVNVSRTLRSLSLDSDTYSLAARREMAVVAMAYAEQALTLADADLDAGPDVSDAACVALDLAICVAQELDADI